MYLTSSLEPTGPKSSRHYLIVHYNNRRVLLALPESYAELENEVKRLYKLERGQFYVETDELNICRGTRVTVPKGVWADVARLIGNVHILSDVDPGIPVSSNPESTPPCHETESLEKPNPEAGSQGEISLNQTFSNGGVLVVKVANLDTEVITTSSAKFEIQMSDRYQDTTLEISFSADRISLTTPMENVTFPYSLKEAFPLEIEHEIIVYRDGAKLNLLCDSQSMGVVKASSLSDFFLTNVNYDLGAQSPFKGPLDAALYSERRMFIEESTSYRSVYPKVDTDGFFQKIIACDPAHGVHALEILSSVRNEIACFQESTSGITLHKHDSSNKKWIDLGWKMQPNTIFVTRMSVTPGAPSEGSSLSLALGSRFSRVLCRVAMNTAIAQIDLQTVVLDQPWPVGGDSESERTIAFLVYRDKMHVLFDFRKSIAFANEKVLYPKACRVFFDVPPGRVLSAEVYHFQQY